MSMSSELADLTSRRNVIAQGGGAERLAKQHDAKKLTARERINLLFDGGSFIELDAFAGDVPCDGVITGFGTVDGRPVFAYAQDFTVLGGSMGKIHGEKIAKVIDMAVKTGAPIVAMPDSGGARIQEGSDALSAMGLVMKKTVMASGVVPQIAAVMGPAAGGSASLACLSDFVFMTKEASGLYMSAPSVIKGKTNADIDAKELGGAMANAEKSGNCHVVCEDDASLIAAVKNLLSYLPANNLEDAPIVETDDVNRLSEVLESDAPVDIKTKLAEVADAGSVFELGAFYGQSIVTALARIGGMTVGFVANAGGGLICACCAEKATRFVRFCDAFNIPVVSFIDIEGYVADVEQEYKGLARKMAALSYAYAEATVPKVSIISGRAYGSAYIAMGSKHIGADVVYAYPTAEIGVMQAEGATTILFKNKMAEAEDPIAARKAFVEEYKETYANPYEAAKHGYVDDVIEPSSTRQRVAAALYMLAGKREVLPSKKHGTMPL